VIHYFIGENSFEIDTAVRALVDSFSGTVQRVDGSELLLRDIPDLLMSATLFADRRLIIVKDLSLNKTVWPVFPDWLERLSDDVELVLIDAKPDKRTATYRALKDAVREFPAWTERDTAKAETWLLKAGEGLGLDKKTVHHLVQRVGVDQWRLSSALEKLRLVDTVNLDVIDDVIDSSPSENVFNVFETALKGDAKRLRQMVLTLELTADPYQLFALLSSQVFQLAAIHAAEPNDAPARDFAIHPFVVSKLSSYARALTARDIRLIIKAFADSDADMKRSKAEPWLLIERALLKVVVLAGTR